MAVIFKGRSEEHLIEEEQKIDSFQANNAGLVSSAREEKKQDDFDRLL